MNALRARRQNRLTTAGVRASLIAILAATLTFAVALPASADDLIPPGSPNPVNVLPSTVRGSMPLTGVPGSQQYLATMLYSYARTPEFWAAAQRVNAGTATAGEITLVQQRNGTYAVPATRTQTLTKVVGGIGTAITGYSLGTMIGNGTLDLIGYDADGAVCQNTTGIARDALALLTGVDCSGFMEIPAEFIPNEDATSTGLASGLCTAGPPGTNVSLSPGTGGSWPAPAPPLNSCAAGYVSWTPNAATTPLTVVGYGQVVSIVRSGATFTATTYTTYHGAVAGGTTRTSQIFFACLNSAKTGIAPGSTVGGGGIPSAAGPGTVSYTVVGAGTCTSGGVAHVVSRMPLAGSSTGAWADQVVWMWTDGVELPPVVPESGDPLRTLRCVVTHSGGELSRDSDPFRETDGVLPQVLCPDIAGLAVESIKVLNVNTEDGSWTVLYEESTTPEYQEHQTTMPECAAGTCLLDLRKEGASCFQAPSSCASWFTDPDKGSKYSCHYGTHVVDLGECTIYAPTFQPGSTTTGNTYGDPESGAAVTNPTATAGSDPDGSGAACWPSGWAAFNPLEWVYRPIVCAFTPRESVVTAQLTRIETALANTAPGGIVATVSAWTFEPVMTGCKIEFTHWETGQTLPIVDACTGPMAQIATISRVVSFVACCVIAISLVRRQIAGIVDYKGN